jgi:hypothetical protein
VARSGTGAGRRGDLPERVRGRGHALGPRRRGRLRQHLFDGSNGDWGTFELLIDGSVEDQVAFGSPACCAPVRDSLSASMAVAAGPHEIRIRVTRPYTVTAAAGGTPFQYVDNVSLVPEPRLLVLLAAAWLGAAIHRR